ncbi:hypothetical protein INQ07_26180, partial [Escherichia coli]|nr:hypothetical protein [Escherichia coli]
ARRTDLAIAQNGIEGAVRDPAGKPRIDPSTLRQRRFVALQHRRSVEPFSGKPRDEDGDPIGVAGEKLG